MIDIKMVRSWPYNGGHIILNSRLHEYFYTVESKGKLKLGEHFILDIDIAMNRLDAIARDDNLEYAVIRHNIEKYMIELTLESTT